MTIKLHSGSQLWEGTDVGDGETENYIPEHDTCYLARLIGMFSNILQLGE